MKDRLRINPEALDEINSFLTEENNPVIDRVVELVERYGGAKRINELAEENRKLEVLMEKLQHKKPEYAEQVNWLSDQKDNKKFVAMENYRKKYGAKDLLDNSYSVTLEISSLHYFPWLIAEAKRAIEREELMPARYIRVRYMKEQEEDGDLFSYNMLTRIS